MHLNWTPRSLPQRAVLEGRTVRLEPIDPRRHAGPLFAAAEGPGCDPHLWDHLRIGPFGTEEAFSAWLAPMPTEADIAFAVVDLATARPGGMCAYLRIRPQHGVLEIGRIWFGPALQRTRQATEAIYLLLRHAFDALGYRRVEWRCDARNERSRRAAERLGFTFEGLFRQEMISKGRNRDNVWLAILDGEWPLLREAFEIWLADGNFDGEGRQRRSLGEIRAEVEARGPAEATSRRA